jgi:hypothetical protein
MGRSVERKQVPEVEWKGIVWKAAYDRLSIKELLTTLKGFGPMEILAFEKPGCFHGELSVSLSEKQTREVTLYHLEVLGPKQQGQGRDALKHLKKIFGGGLYVEDPGIIRVRNADQDSLPFWIKMFEEGLIDAVDAEGFSLQPRAADAEAKSPVADASGSMNR